MWDKKALESVFQQVIGPYIKWRSLKLIDQRIAAEEIVYGFEFFFLSLIVYND